MREKGGAIISYDPNYRASLWTSSEKAVDEICKMLPYADIVKFSDEEAVLITGQKDYSLCVQKRGGIPAIPTSQEVESVIARA